MPTIDFNKKDREPQPLRVKEDSDGEIMCPEVDAYHGLSR